MGSTVRVLTRVQLSLIVTGVLSSLFSHADESHMAWSYREEEPGHCSLSVSSQGSKTCLRVLGGEYEQLAARECFSSGVNVPCTTRPRV